MMKIIFANVLLAVLSFNVLAQEPGRTDDNFGAQREDGGYETGWVMKVDGNVVVCEEGETQILQEEARLPDGTRVVPDGTVETPDGETIMLRDGQVMYMDGEVAQADEDVMLQERYNIMSRNFGMAEEIQRQMYEKISLVDRKMDLTNRKADLIEEKISHTSRIVFCPNRVSKRDKAAASQRIEEINAELNSLDQELEMVSNQIEEREVSRNP